MGEMNARGRFGSEPMGYDAAGSAGFGRGAFSAGPFGLDAWPLTLAVPLAEEGTHQLLLRAVNENGGSAQADPVGVQSNPPPEPPIALSPTAYVNGILVLELVPG